MPLRCGLEHFLDGGNSVVLLRAPNRKNLRRT